MVDTYMLVEDLMEISEDLRFVGIVDLEGRFLDGMVNDRTTDALKEAQMSLCEKLGERRRAQEELDGSLGRLRYEHVERESVTEISLYMGRHTVHLALEPEAPAEDKMAALFPIRGIDTPGRQPRSGFITLGSAHQSLVRVAAS